VAGARHERRKAVLRETRMRRLHGFAKLASVIRAPVPTQLPTLSGGPTRTVRTPRPPGPPEATAGGPERFGQRELKPR